MLPQLTRRRKQDCGLSYLWLTETKHQNEVSAITPVKGTGVLVLLAKICKDSH